MDLRLTEDQEMLRRTVREFAQRELAPVAARYDESEEFPEESIRKIAALGLCGLTIDPKYGGSGGDYIQLAIAMEELAHADAAVAVSWGAGLSLGTNAIYRFGTEAQKRRFIPPLARGERLAAFGLTEPNAGSDTAALETTARRGDGYYTLDGTKVLITNGDVAGTVVVFATVDRSLGSKGITAFVVEKGTPGFTSPKREHKLGIRASPTAQLVFDNCRVPADQRLGEEGQGLKIALSIIDSSRIVIAAQAVGIAQAALDASVAYAQQRKQFGQYIGSFQAIQWMLADMATRIEASRLLTYQTADLKERGQPFSKHSAMAKLFASESAMWVTTKAIQIHGGYGYLKDYPVERYFRDAKITEIYEGTSEIQRLVIARNLLGQLG
ncbi:MAG: acyl-CoA dehydrogenase [Chloroflexi bacterium]|nr:acyl-CoA dehydrogenase [Chloroflexota bacterium]